VFNVNVARKENAERKLYKNVDGKEKRNANATGLGEGGRGTGGEGLWSPGEDNP